uniref:Uncharacterized protein n=1 Tax=Panagrolaimus sp. PS1159 TaxID=55785 RepID=A0AC35F6Q2_9BILA
MLREFFKRHQKVDIGTQTVTLARLESAPTVMKHPTSIITPTTKGDEHYNFPPPPEKEKPTILYSDKFCELTKFSLKIFHFPEHPKGSSGVKQILIPDIKKVYYQDQESFWDCCSVAIVGYNRKTVWAFDYSRYTFSCCCSAPPSETNIVINIGQQINYGFTVIDGPVFTSSLKKILNSNVEFFEGIP